MATIHISPRIKSSVFFVILESNGESRRSAWSPFVNQKRGQEREQTRSKSTRVQFDTCSFAERGNFCRLVRERSRIDCYSGRIRVSLTAFSINRLSLSLHLDARIKNANANAPAFAYAFNYDEYLINIYNVVRRKINVRTRIAEYNKAIMQRRLPPKRGRGGTAVCGARAFLIRRKYRPFYNVASCQDDLSASANGVSGFCPSRIAQGGSAPRESYKCITRA